MALGIFLGCLTEGFILSTLTLWQQNVFLYIIDIYIHIHKQWHIQWVIPPSPWVLKNDLSLSLGELVTPFVREGLALYIYI